MIKKKMRFSILFICSFGILNIAKAQSYNIESFEGTKTKINLTEVLRGRVLVVSCLGDSLFVNDYIAVKEVHVLSKRFLEINYNGGGGTGSDVSNTLLLSVNKAKITVSMLVTSYASWFSPNPDNTNSIDKKGLYTLKLIMAGNDKSNYRLSISIHDQLSSKLHPRTSYNKNERVTLSFDPIQNIFYSASKIINQSFIINDPKTQRSGKQQISGTLPIIDLGKNKYYYIKGEWYGRGYDDNLFKGYYK